MFRQFSQLHSILGPLSILLAIFILSIGVGCQAASDHPWKAEAYTPPSNHKPLPRSTYAPVPSILPSVEGPEVEAADERGPDDLEQVLRELDIK